MACHGYFMLRALMAALEIVSLFTSGPNLSHYPFTKVIMVKKE